LMRQVRLLKVSWFKNIDVCFSVGPAAELPCVLRLHPSTVCGCRVYKGADPQRILRPCDPPQYMPLIMKGAGASQRA